MRSRFAKYLFALTAACLLMAALAGSVHSAGFFHLGFFPGGGNFSEADDVSADGSVVVGYGQSVSGHQAFRWTSGGGMIGLGNVPGAQYSYATSVSADGSFIVGHSNSESGWEAFRWTGGDGMIGLGDFPGGEFYSTGHSVSADGSVIVGSGSSTSGREALSWTSAEGMVGLGYLRGGSCSVATNVSADGSVIVGLSNSDLGFQAFRWTNGHGMIGLGDLPGVGPHFHALASDVSADGSVVVGHSNSAVSGAQAFRWTTDEGMVGLGYLPGENYSYATSVSANGSVVVGVSSYFQESDEAFIWDDSNGMRKLRDVLSPDVGAKLDGWTLNVANAISADGRTIAGYGTNPSGNTEAWVVYLGAEVPEPASRVTMFFGLLVLGFIRRPSLSKRLPGALLRVYPIRPIRSYPCSSATQHRVCPLRQFLYPSDWIQ